MAATNNSGGTDATQRFDAWGIKVASTGTAPHFGYTGREPDETGLVYYRARYYDPTLGRFTQRDPIGFSGGVNRYRYVNDNPIMYYDPLGLFGYAGGTSVSTTAIVGYGVTGGTNGEFFSDGSANTYGVAGTGWGADVSADAQVNGALYFGSGPGGAGSWAGDFTAINVGAFGGVVSIFWGGGWVGISVGAGVAPEGVDFGATVTMP